MSNAWWSAAALIFLGAPYSGARAEEPETSPAPTEVDVSEAGTPKQSQKAPVLEKPSSELESVADLPPEEDGKGWGLQLSIGHALGPGTFAKNDQLREQSDYFGQTWRFSGYYAVDLFGHRLKVSPAFAFSYEYTQPNRNPARRFNPGDASLSISDGELLSIPGGIKVKGGMRWSFPTSYTSRNITRLYGAYNANLALSRKFGSLSLSYGFSASKFFNRSKVKTDFTQALRASDFATRRVSGTTSELDAGFANTSFSISNSVAASYNVTENFSFSYSVAIINQFKYKLSNNDALRAAQADSGRGRSDRLSPNLGVSYALSKGLKGIAHWPVKLSLAAGIAASHPAKTADNKRILLPFFYNTFGQNRAANNFGSIYFDIVGSY